MWLLVAVTALAWARCRIGKPSESRLVLLAAGALTSIGLYSLGLFHSERVPFGADSLFDFLIAHPGGVILFICAFVGAPIGWALDGLRLVTVDGMLHPSTAIGGLMILGTCTFGALAWRRGAALPGFALAGFSPHERYTAYAVMRDGRSACHVGVIGRGPEKSGLRTGGPPT